MARTHEALRKAEQERRGLISQGARFDLPLPARPSGAAQVNGLAMTSRALVEYHKLKYNLLRLNSHRRLKVLSAEMSTFGNDYLNIVRRHFF